MKVKVKSLPTPLFLDFPCGSDGKESDSGVGDLGLIPGLGRSTGEGIGYTLQYSAGEFHGLHSPWGRKESDTTERLSPSLWVSGLSCTRGSSKSAESPNCLLPSARKQESLRQSSLSRDLGSLE